MATQCIKCCFFEKLYPSNGAVTLMDDEAVRNGFCRRYPPAVDDGFPTVGKDEWCGEFKPMPEESGKRLAERTHFGTEPVGENK